MFRISYICLASWPDLTQKKCSHILTKFSKCDQIFFLTMCESFSVFMSMFFPILYASTIIRIFSDLKGLLWKNKKGYRLKVNHFSYWLELKWLTFSLCPLSFFHNSPFKECESITTLLSTWLSPTFFLASMERTYFEVINFNYIYRDIWYTADHRTKHNI